MATDREPWLSQLLTELRNRHVIHVLGTYLLTSWGIIQVSTTIFPLIGVPVRVATWLFFLLLFFLPIVLVAAWTFDMTPEGVRRTDNDLSRRIRFRPRLAAAVAIPVFALGLGAAWTRERVSNTVDKRSIAVFPFSVSAPTTFENMNDGVAQMIADKLSGEGGLRAVTPLVAIKAWDRAAASTGNLDERDAVSIARDLGAGQTLIGSVIGGGDRITISARIYDAVTHAEQARAEVTGPVSELIPLVDRLMILLLSRRASESEEHISSLTTTSLPALKRYLDGQTAYRAGEFVHAQELFGQALDIDSTFALAALAHAKANVWTNSNKRGLSLARAYQAKLGPRDRQLVAGLEAYASDSLSFRELIEKWEAVATTVPDDPDAMFLLGDVYFHTGPAVGMPDAHERAYKAFMRTIELDSTHAAALMHVFSIAAPQGDQQQLSRLAQLYLRAERQRPNDAPVLANRWIIAQVMRDSTALRQIRSTIDSLGGRTLIPMGAAFYDGLPLTDNDRQLRLRIRNAVTRPERVAAMNQHAFTLTQRGQFTEAMSYAPEIDAMPTPAPRSANQAVVHALWFEGDWERAKAAALVMKQYAGSPHLHGRARYAAPCTLGEWELANRDTSNIHERIAQIERGSALRDGIAPWNLGSCALRLRARLTEIRTPGARNLELERLDSLLAIGAIANDGNFQAANITSMRLHEERGEYEAALAAARRRVHGMGAHGLPVQLFGQGKLAEKLGYVEEARRAFEIYLNLRHAPDPGTPAHKNAQYAREALARLR